MPKIEVNDLNVYYELAGEGAPLVLIAGLGGDHLGWMETQLPSFTAAGYRCLVFDNRDAGQTGESPRTSYTIRQLADDTAALMTRLSLGPAHVAGMSMGGMIAQELVLNHPDRVRSLTLVCTTARSDPYMRHLVRSWQTARRQCTVEEFVEMLGLWLFTHRFYAVPEAVQRFMQQVIANPFPQSVGAFLRQCEAILTHDTRDRLSTVRAPAHVIVGAEDILTAPRYARVLSEQIPAARLTVVPESGHALFWEKPVEFNRAVLDFLQEH